MINKGDQINMKNGCVATVTRIGMGDFIGDPYPVYVQYVKDGVPVLDVIMSNEVRGK